MIRDSTSVGCSKELRSTSTSRSQAVQDEVGTEFSVLTFCIPRMELKPLHEIIILMSITEIIVHRGNSPVNTKEPLEQVRYYAKAGFNKIEIDVYATSETTYKFCHPLDRDKVNEIHSVNDGFLENMVNQLPKVEWYIDLKCLDLDEVPFKLLQYLINMFGDSGIITAAHAEIVEYAHNQNQKTAQYFKDNIPSKLNYEPDFFVHNESDTKSYKKEKTIIYCSDPKVALNYLEQGYAGAMVDGNKLISS